MPLRLDLENESGHWVGREDLPRVITLWNFFQGPALSDLFPSVKTSYPTERRKHWWEEGACGHAESTQYHACKCMQVSPHPGSTAPTCSLQPLDIFRLPDNLPALKPQLPAQENVGEKNIYQNNYTTPWLSSLVSGSCLFCLYFHPALGPDFCMLFWVFLSIRKHKWIFLFSIGSYYPYCPATCCFLKWLDYQDWLHMKIA